MNLKMRRGIVALAFGLAVCGATVATLPAQTEIFGTAHGIVHDPPRRPVQGAMVDPKELHADWIQHQKTNDNGEFDFGAAPLGECTVMVTLTNFQQAEQIVVAESPSGPVLHFQFALASVTEITVVTGEPVITTIDSVTPTTLLNGLDVQETPGASRTNSMAIITDYVSGA
jgi:hypothetical protein